MIYDQTIGIFPTPVSFYKLDRDFTKEELNFFNSNKTKVFNNYGNKATTDGKILENETMKSLKDEILLCLKNYYENVVCSSDKIEPYITQSWLNYTKQGEYHHAHEHPNSMVSGVLYIDADDRYDNICFIKPGYNQFVLNLKEYNTYNSEAWNFNVKSKQIILFPSSLRHEVYVKQDNKLRISLAFNSFIRGTIGSPNRFAELTIL